jgi:hypothetical protein
MPPPFSNNGCARVESARDRGRCSASSNDRERQGPSVWRDMSHDANGDEPVHSLGKRSDMTGTRGWRLTIFENLP